MREVKASDVWRKGQVNCITEPTQATPLGRQVLLSSRLLFEFIPANILKIKGIITLKTSKRDGSHSDVSVVAWCRRFTSFVTEACQRHVHWASPYSSCTTDPPTIYFNRILQCYIWSIALYGAKEWTLRKMDQKYLESFEMWCWRWMEKISWTDRVRNEEVLHRVKEKRNILHTIKRKKA
jgi:hypothetical protein